MLDSCRILKCPGKTNRSTLSSHPNAPKTSPMPGRRISPFEGTGKTAANSSNIFPHEAVYRHSLAEEIEALTAEIKVLEKLEGDVETAEMVTENPSLLLLLNLHQAGVLEPYVLFRLADEDIGKDYPNYRSRNRSKLEQYLDKFVVPPAPSKTTEMLTAPAQR